VPAPTSSAASPKGAPTSTTTTAKVTPSLTRKANPRKTSKPTPQPKPAAQQRKVQRSYLVSHVVDGDTIDLANGSVIRLVGIDTPERGQCGYAAATSHMEQMVGGKRVTLSLSDEDHDRYGRLLRYVNIGKMDAGLRQIKAGLAIARYDSRDGYGFHPREPLYIAADKRTPSKTVCASKPKHRPARISGGAPSCEPGYSPCLPIADDLNCADVNGPIAVTGSDPYGLDRDGDGIACET